MVRYTHLIGFKTTKEQFRNVEREAKKLKLPESEFMRLIVDLYFQDNRILIKKGGFNENIGKSN